MTPRRRGLGSVDEAVGARLRFYRIAKKLSQEAFGKAIGVTFQQVQKYETGRNSVAAARIPLVCAALGITPNDLFGFEKKNGKEPLPVMSTVAVGLALEIDRMAPNYRSLVVTLVRQVLDLVRTLTKETKK